MAKMEQREEVAVVEREPNLLATMAHQYGHGEDKYRAALKVTCLSQMKNATEGEVNAFLTVCHQYDLNPLTSDIYCFRKKGDGGGIQAVLGVDGWIRMINRAGHDGIEFEEVKEEKDNGIKCRIYLKGVSRPVEITEWLSECRRNTGPWKSHERRMLRHKALIQCARVAMGLGSFVDPDEAERIQEADYRVVDTAQEVVDRALGKVKAATEAAKEKVEEPHSDTVSESTPDPRRGARKAEVIHQIADLLEQCRPETWKEICTTLKVDEDCMLEELKYPQLQGIKLHLETKLKEATPS